MEVVTRIFGIGGCSSGGRNSVGNFFVKAAGARDRLVEVVDLAGGEEARAFVFAVAERMWWMGGRASSASGSSGGSKSSASEASRLSSSGASSSSSVSSMLS